MLTGCHAGAAATVRPPPPPAAAVDLARLAGTFAWSHREVGVDGVAVIEHERWQLTAHGDRLDGGYDREVSFLAGDGQPFRCSQTLAYRLRTHYVVHGRRRGGAVDLREVSFTVMPSPCEPDHRALVTYHARPTATGVDLSYPGGIETLVRSDEAAATAPAGGIAGAWTWHDRTEDPRGRVRVERERWTLTASDGHLAGGYHREVVEFAEDGDTFACTGATTASRSEDVAVTGTIDGDRIFLRETAATGQPAPCAPAGPLHLDAATGVLSPDLLELTWRGQSRQVLARVRDASTER